MATLNKTFNFTANGESFVFTSGGKGTGTWSATGGNTGGCWSFNSLGRNNTDTSYIELTTTWEALGIPSGATINSITSSSEDWRCSAVNVSSGWHIAPFQIFDNTPTLQATLQTILDGAGVTSYASKTGGTVAVPTAIQTSGTTIRLRFSVGLDNGNNANAQTTVLLDNISLDIDYSVTSTTLVVQDSSHTHTAESPILGQYYTPIGYNADNDFMAGFCMSFSDNQNFFPNQATELWYRSFAENESSVYVPSELSYVAQISGTNNASARGVHELEGASAPPIGTTVKYELYYRMLQGTNGRLVLFEGLNVERSVLGLSATDWTVLSGEYTSQRGEDLDFTPYAESSGTIGDTMQYKLAIWIEPQSINLVPSDTTHNHTADNVTLQPSTSLTVQGATHNHTSDNVTISHATSLVVQDVTHNHTVDNVVLTATAPSIILVVQDTTHNHTVDVLNISVSYIVTINDASHPHTSSNVVLSPKYNLVSNDSTHNHTADNVALDLSVTLIVANSNHVHTVDNTVLSTKHLLIVDNSSHTHTANNVTLSNSIQLTVNNSSHSHKSDSVVLTSKYGVLPNDSSHVHTVDNVISTTKYNILPSDSSHGHTADNVGLTSIKYSLVPSDSSHNHTSSNVTLSASGYLEVQSSTHNHTSENVDLFVKALLSVQDSSHSHTSENVVLSVKTDLVVDNTTHNHTADNVLLSNSLNLFVDDSSHQHKSDSVILSTNTILVVGDSSHSHTSDNAVLFTKYLLLVDDSTHNHRASNITFVFGGTNIYLGDIAISKMYLGNNLITIN